MSSEPPSSPVSYGSHQDGSSQGSLPEVDVASAPDRSYLVSFGPDSCLILGGDTTILEEFKGKNIRAIAFTKGFLTQLGVHDDSTTELPSPSEQVKTFTRLAALANSVPPTDDISNPAFFPSIPGLTDHCEDDFDPDKLMQSSTGTFKTCTRDAIAQHDPLTCTLMSVLTDNPTISRLTVPGTFPGIQPLIAMTMKNAPNLTNLAFDGLGFYPSEVTQLSTLIKRHQSTPSRKITLEFGDTARRPFDEATGEEAKKAFEVYGELVALVTKSEFDPCDRYIFWNVPHFLIGDSNQGPPGFKIVTQGEIESDSNAETVSAYLMTGPMPLTNLDPSQFASAHRVVRDPETDQKEMEKFVIEWDSCVNPDIYKAQPSQRASMPKLEFRHGGSISSSCAALVQA
ncbi:hypothetical protein BCR39DRAFT_506551 [Naematelia encephala]|uniref:Uncharacterized protein n=1 Tax=Naematelia encephala TaxID=71784 RepID=A0A1Y2AW89_9TREE|nr:hypothetical protein BCR39DRAFT_506551 [Naematelia encephala]